MHELSLSNIFWEFIKKCNMGSYEMHWWKVCKILRNPVARMGKLKMGGLGSTNVELSIYNKGNSWKISIWGCIVGKYAELSLISMIWEFIKLGGKFVFLLPFTIISGKFHNLPNPKLKRKLA